MAEDYLTDSIDSGEFDLARTIFLAQRMLRAYYHS